jgi:tetratricopeptide (TPR) repeat protein
MTDQTAQVVPTDYERLLRFLVAPGPAFGFAIARYTDPRVRDGLIQRLELDAAALNTHVVTIDLSNVRRNTDLVERVHSLLEPDSAGDAPTAAFVVRLDRFLVDPHGAPNVSASIRALNMARDNLRKAWPARVVFWLSDAAAKAFATFAYDLHDVALTLFRFDEREADVVTRPRFGDVPDWLRLAQDEDTPRLQREAALLEVVLKDTTEVQSQAENAFRIAQIRSVLPDPDLARYWFQRAIHLFSEAKDGQGEAKAWLRLGDFCRFRGDLDVAMEQYKRAEQLFVQASNELEIAVTRGRIADILQDRGQLDEALEIRQNHELPVYQKLGDIRSEAITRGRIADILQDRGQLDEALEIRQNQQLPVYQKLGDIRSEAITRGQIADILQDRGQLDEALEIRQNQQLPVYQKLGDIRSEAVCRAKIAIVLMQRQQPGDNEEAIRLLRLARVTTVKMKLPETDIIDHFLRQLGQEP